ncbi:MAG TPA: hypothetical protein V6C85_39090 [Allocoleopsis sp.]
MQQTYNNWQQSSIQGEIPSPIEPLAEIGESLKNALSWLENARCLMESGRLQERYSRLFEAVCDATHYNQLAVERLEDTPDE